ANGGVQKAYQLMQTESDEKARFMIRIDPAAAAKNLPDKLTLYQNYANPFEESTTIRFALPLQGRVSIIIYDILGRKVFTLRNDKRYNAGYHEVTWKPEELASGVYLYVLRANDKMRSRKMT